MIFRVFRMSIDLSTARLDVNEDANFAILELIDIPGFVNILENE
jgi:hypothetical protein